MLARLTHLDRLEAEAIHIFREVAATFSKPVILYSVGKDSSVLLHLAMKAFYPAKPPFPFLHVDTTWKFREMIEFRDAMAARTASICWCTSTRMACVRASTRSTMVRTRTRM